MDKSVGIFHNLHNEPCSMIREFNSLPSDKILDWSKFKVFADNKINATEKLKIVMGRIENIIGKGENAG